MFSEETKMWWRANWCMVAIVVAVLVLVYMLWMPEKGMAGIKWVRGKATGAYDYVMGGDEPKAAAAAS
jgi:hypothetical protein